MATNGGLQLVDEMQFRILGPLEVVDGAASLPLGGGKQRALLAFLLLNANEVVSSDRLIDELWGENSPGSGRAALQVRVSQLRKALGRAGAWLLTRPPGYVLQLDREQLDLYLFERLVGEAEIVEPAVAAVRLREALALWRGPPLADLAYESFAQSAIGGLEELRAAAIEKRIDADLAIGRHRELVAELETLVVDHPSRERLAGQLMLALYRCGRQGDALAVFGRTRVHLTGELGIEPGPQLTALQAAILNQDPSVAPPPDRQTETVRRNDNEPPSTQIGARRHERKVVSVLFCDVTGSTALGEDLDPEALFAVMARYFEEVRAVIERHGGTVAKFIGDAVTAVFGIPRVHEDDALRAVRAAAEIRAQLPTVAEGLGVALRLRAGVNTGLVLVGDGENLAVGDAVNVAARLEQAAQPGEILLADETLRLVRDAVEVEPLGPLLLKGRSEPVRLCRLLSVDPLAPGLARRFDVPLVGRERELRLLTDAWERTVTESGCQLFTLLGVAGVGKSRLVAELRSELADRVSVLSGRCLPYGEGITFWPLIEALSGAGASSQPVLERLGTGAATAEELFLEVRRLLESLAAERPVILHIDDLQWAESRLLDLLDHIVELSRGVPLLLLCVARPELLEDRSSWGGGKLNLTSVMLEPLGTENCEVLLDLLGDKLDPGARARVITASEGNPLFLEEMAALARETGDVGSPPTIHALLAARLEQLPLEERQVLERGAVEGEVFHRRVLGALVDEENSNSEVDSRLAGLVRKDLIRPHQGTIPGDTAFRFRHLLIRDAAYDALPKATRARLHERLAAWLEDSGSNLAEIDEIAGWHLEQTIRYRRELGQLVEPELASGAVARLYAAGRHARERSDVPAAKGFLERALALAPADEARHTEIAVDLAAALIEAGELGRADALLRVCERDREDLRTVLTRCEWLARARPDDGIGTIKSRLPELLERFAHTADGPSLARAHILAFNLEWLDGQATAAGAQARLAAKHARDAGDDGLRERALEWYASSLTYGQAAADTMAAELDAIESEPHGPHLAASIDMGRAEVARLEGQFADARRLSQRAIEAVQALGIPGGEAGLEQGRGRMELLMGNPAAALAALRRSDAIFEEMGDRAFRSTTQAWLADAYAQLGNLHHARAAIKLAEELGGSEDIGNYVITHQVRARLALADGDRDNAEHWARSAVDLASRADDMVDQANTRLGLASVLTALRRSDEAILEARTALDLFMAKGDRPGAGRARQILDNLAGMDE